MQLRAVTVQESAVHVGTADYTANAGGWRTKAELRIQVHGDTLTVRCISIFIPTYWTNVCFLRSCSPLGGQPSVISWATRRIWWKLVFPTYCTVVSCTVICSGCRIRTGDCRYNSLCVRRATGLKFELANLVDLFSDIWGLNQKHRTFLLKGHWHHFSPKVIINILNSQKVPFLEAGRIYRGKSRLPAVFDIFTVLQKSHSFRHII